MQQSLSSQNRKKQVPGGNTGLPSCFFPGIFFVMLCWLFQALTPDVPTSISATTALWANAHKVEHDDQHPSSRCTLQVLPLSHSLPGQPQLLLTENDAPTGRRIHLGGFFRGRTTLCGAVCWGSCRGGRGCPVPNGSRFPNEDESFDKNKKGERNSETPSPISQAASSSFFCTRLVLLRAWSCNTPQRFPQAHAFPSARPLFSAACFSIPGPLASVSTRPCCLP